MANREYDNELHCSFCGRPESEVQHLIAGPHGVYICDMCVEVCNNELGGSTKESVLDEVELPTPQQMKAELDKYIVGQDRAKEVLAVAVYNHYKRVNYNVRSNKKSRKKERNRGDFDDKTAGKDDKIELQKSNILMFGPSGSGKTLLAQTLSRILNVPFAIADATTLTEAGYVGDDVENILLRLIKNADYDIASAERGIIYIDEIDKIARKSENMSITRDVSGEGVQQALLKIIESTVSSVPPNGGRKHPQQECINMDTTNVLFILGGAFVGLDKVVGERKGTHSLGFERDVTPDENKKDDMLAAVQPQDLIKYGLIPELVGRIPVTVALKELTVDDLVHVIKDPKNSIVKQYTELLKLDGVELVFEEEALRAIAQKAIDLGTGARGLRTIVEGLMLESMFGIPSDKTIKKLIVNEKCVTENADPIIIRETDSKIA